MTTKATIYIVVAGQDYEGSSPVKAFTLEAAANLFADACRKYDETKVNSPPIKDNPENDVFLNKWLKKNDRWRQNHPAKRTGSDYYSVIPVELCDQGDGP